MTETRRNDGLVAGVLADRRTVVFDAPDGQPAIRMLDDDELIVALATEIAALTSENRLLRDELRMCWLLVKDDAYDAPGRISTAIRPFLEGVVERHDLQPKAATEAGR
jgi:hypothetical protein